MGSIFSSPKESNDVINLSDDCLKRIAKPEEPPQEQKEEAAEKQKAESDDPLKDIPHNLNERKNMMILKCHDDVHSQESGLTVQHFNKLFDKVESQIEPVRPNLCSGEEVIECIRKNPNCLVKCKHLLDRYIDCIDTFRINIIKEQMECEEKEKRKEEQQVIDEFLSGPADCVF